MSSQRTADAAELANFFILSLPAFLRSDQIEKHMSQMRRSMIEVYRLSGTKIVPVILNLIADFLA